MTTATKRTVEAIYPLSPMQRGMLFHSLYAPTSGVYVEQLTCEIHGQLDLSAFEQAWQTVVARHPILRTAFVWEGVEEPVQVVQNGVNLPITAEEWHHLSPTDIKTRLETFLEEEKAQGFDLAQAPLMRFTIIPVAPEKSIIVWSNHHMLMDGWSRGIVLQEVFRLYNAHRQGQTLRLRKVRPFRDYINWLHRQNEEEQDNFWRDLLDGFIAPTQLNVDTAVVQPSNVTAANQGRHAITLDRPHTQKLLHLARQQQLTLNTIIQAAWGLLLSIYSTNKDVVFGITVSGRSSSLLGIQSMVGLLINTVPTRLHIDPNHSLLDWLNHIHKQMARISQYEYTPLSRIQQLSHVPNNQPLFDTILAFENYPIDATTSDNKDALSIQNVQTYSRTNYPINVVVEPGPELAIEILYDPQRFTPGTIERMLTHLHTILTDMGNNPGKTLGEIRCLSSAEQQQICAWGRFPTTYPRQETLSTLFDKQVQKRPEQIALIYGDETLTYAQVNQRANQLAHYLQENGVGRETAVGLCLERSFDMLIATLAILKAGGVYVPIDPNYPIERISFMMTDTHAPVILTHTHLHSQLPPHTHMINLDKQWPHITHYPTHTPTNHNSPHDLAYIIYTSGSTGIPKGVAVTHQNVVRLVKETNYMNFGPDQTFLQFAPISFDAATLEIWGSLLNGSPLVIYPAGLPDLQTLGDLLLKHKVSALWLTAGLFHQMIEENLPALKPVRQLLAGGDVLSVNHVKQFLETFPQNKLINGYGPTENTTFTTCYPMQQNTYIGTTVPIGRPIANTEVYILNEQMHTVPIGVPGDLYTGADGLSRGYFRRPQLTADKFIPNPFSQEGQRLYRTGDRARYLPDGTIEFLGRQDFQVKIRGFRIELGEIATILNQHPHISNVVLTAQEGTLNNKRLIAYYVSHDPIGPATAELRHYLKDKLPDYMVPATFIQLDAIPLTPNGKVDREALPNPDGAGSSPHEFVAPRTPLEQTIADIWSQVLNLDRVGIQDNFFDLGGDSISSIKILSKIREQGLSLTMQQLFLHPTIESLVQNMQSPETPAETTTILPFALITEAERALLPGSLEDAYPMTRLQAGMLFHSEFGTPDDAIYHDVFSYFLKAKFDEEKWQTAVSRLIQTHPILRTTFDLTSYPAPLQLVHKHIDLPLHIEDLSPLPPSQQEEQFHRWFKQEKTTPIDWTKPPLLHFWIHQYTPHTFRFSLSFHHALLDGWSVSAMLTELIQHYFALLQDEPAPTPPPTTHFRQFVAQELEALQTPESQNYWQTQIDNITFTPLPRWPQTAAESTDPIAVVNVPIPHQVSTGLKAVAQKLGVPIKSVLLAAHARVMAVTTGQTDITTGLVTHGRPETEDSDRVLGLFINTVPVHLNLPGGPWTDLIQRAFQAEQQMLPHRHYPIAQIQQDAGNRPLFETVFNFMHLHSYQNLKPLDGLELLETTIYGRTNFPLFVDFGLSLDNAQVTLSLTCDQTQLHPTQVKQLAHYYLAVLTHLAQHPTQNHRHHAFLAPTEQQQLLQTWQNTAHAYQRDHCIHELFQQQVSRTPNEPALIFEDKIHTYHALNERANQLAHYLLAQGITPGTPVAICTERSAEMVIGLLAILKAGGAYIPLDPHYPQQRLQFIMQDADVCLLLTQKRLLADVPQSQKCLCIDTDWAEIAPYPTTNPQTAVTADNLAYIIHTSGSTGQPKGVMISHHMVHNFFIGMDQHIGTDAPGVWLALTSISFDISVLELFWTLARGYKLVLQGEDLLPPPQTNNSDQPSLFYFANDTNTNAQQDYSVAAHIQKHKVTHLQCTPSTARMLLLDDATAQSLTHLHKLMLGGETLPLPLAQQLQQTTSATLQNMYGPTETTIWSTTHRLPLHTEQISIGRPIANTQIYILDPYHHPVPVGVVGDLYIAGEGVAQGYLKRPSLTAARFIPNSFSPTPGTRLYHTGDKARYLPTGDIEFLGRGDFQVKVRGYRIELGEIETVLSQHPAIGQAVVTTVTDEAQEDTHLVAYIVPSSESAPSVTDIRAHLQNSLPDYMIPAAYIPLEAFPLTPNKKIDRHRLPAPGPQRPHLASTYTPPRSATEEQLCALWQQALNVEKVGIHDNFFELGGHSLTATQLITRLRQTLNIDIPLRYLFESPTVAGLSQRLALIPQTAAPEMPPLTKRSSNQPIPLSFSQQRLWFLEQLEPLGASYTNYTAMRITGPLSVSTLTQVINQVIDRHEALRTVFTLQDGQPMQIIYPSLHLTIPVIELYKLPQDERESQLQAVITRKLRQPFDLAHGPLIRITLFQLASEEYVLLLTLHHIISDGWSIGVVVREVSQLYEAIHHQKTGDLPPLPIQYADYAVWQRQWLVDDVLADQLHYWVQKLQGAPALLELPTDFPRPDVQTFDGTTQPLTLSADLTQTVRTLAQQTGTTPFMILLAVFKLLLARYTDQTDIVVGAPTSGRNLPQTEPLIGIFINMLVLRTDLSGNPTFAQLLHRVRQTALEAYAHQEVPFEKIVDALQPERDMGFSPIFQVAFNYFKQQPLPEMNFSDLHLSPMGLDIGAARFDLSIHLVDASDEMSGFVEYNTNLFRPTTIERLITHFTQLLQTAVTHINQPINTLSLFDQAEETKILQTWNQTAVPHTPTLIHHLIQEQVRIRPHQLAVVHEEQTLTYKQLHQQANQLAHYLITQGVQPDDIVGLSLGRSLEMVIALVAIFKAGAAYLPLDPAYPQDRLQFMIADAQIRTLITNTHYQAALPHHTAPTLLVDTVDLAAYPTTPPQVPVTITNLAYIIYTSGSTGQPKGVALSHYGLSNLAEAQRTTFDLQPNNRILQFSSLNFDASTFEIVMALHSGATLYLGQPDQFAHLLQTHQITNITVPPSILSTLPHQDFPALKTIVVAGEACPASLVSQWASAERRFFNAYGPTETTIWASVSECTANGEKPHIGRPIQNTQIYLLDHTLRPVPVSVPGQLYIGGMGLARGYLARPSLTAARFIPHPFSPEEGARLYKTGDLARYLPDGSIEFIGRIDHQVKLRGFRIELDEIQAVLEQVETVQETAVIIHQPTPHVKQLVAYLIADDTIDESEILTHLQQKLPDYMVPHHLIQLEQMPLTPNGKLDRRALPTPHIQRPADAAYAAPQDEIEQELAQLWADALGLEAVGIHDNFFALGGDSILSIQIVAQASEANLHLTTRHIFKHQTIAELAPHVTRTAATTAEQEPITGPLPLNHIQRWFLEQPLENPHHWNQTLLLELHQRLDAEHLATAAEAIIHHHDALRLKLIQQQGEWQALIEEPAQTPSAFQHIDLSTIPPDQVADAIEAKAGQIQASTRLDHSPLLKVVLLELGQNQSQRLLLTAHHTVVDGVSWRILLNDLQTAYQQLNQGRPIKLPRKTTSIREWAEALHQYAQSPTIQDSLPHWEALLETAQAELPVDKMGTDNSEASSMTVTVHLDADETRALLQDVPATYHTQINDALLSALAQAVGQWTESTHTVVDLEGHGREPWQESLDLSRTVGWFTNLHPFVIDLSDAQTAESALKAVQQQRQHLPHNGLSYSLLRYISQVESLCHHPTADIVFNYLGQFDHTLPEASPFEMASEPVGPMRHPTNQRPHLIEVTSFIANNRLVVNWIYSQNFHQAQTIQEVAHNYIQALRNLIQDCQAVQTGDYRLADFPLAHLTSEDDLDTILDQIEFEL